MAQAPTLQPPAAVARRRFPVPFPVPLRWWILPAFALVLVAVLLAGRAMSTPSPARPMAPGAVQAEAAFVAAAPADASGAAASAADGTVRNG